MVGGEELNAFTSCFIFTPLSQQEVHSNKTLYDLLTFSVGVSFHIRSLWDQVCAQNDNYVHKKFAVCLLPWRYFVLVLGVFGTDIFYVVVPVALDKYSGLFGKERADIVEKWDLLHNVGYAYA